MLLGINGAVGAKEHLVSNVSACVKSRQQDSIASIGIQRAIGLIGEIRPGQDLPTLQCDVTERKQFVVHIVYVG